MVIILELTCFPEPRIGFYGNKNGSEEECFKNSLHIQWLLTELQFCLLIIFNS